MTPGRLAITLVVPVLAAGALIAGCGDDAGGSGSDNLSGRIVIDGSSTVAPLSSAAAEEFNAENSGVDIEVRTSGTGGGFEVFCKGETDISDASRPINDDEKAACQGSGVAFEEFRVASDGITLVTKADADVGKDCITMEQLKAIWIGGSKIKNWKDVGPGFTDVGMALAGAGSQSGTYDFFNETVLGEDAAGETLVPRQDYSASEDDNVTVRAVESAPAGLGYFGFSYFEENQDQLKAFGLDAGDGCITPTPETITDGSYPLSRPLFVYVNTEKLSQPHVKAFVRNYLENAVQLAEGQKFVPAPQDALDEALGRVPA
jgi:phosphate transport system substrate-binding protein